MNITYCLRDIRLPSIDLEVGTSSNVVNSEMCNGSHPIKNIGQNGATFLGKTATHDDKPTKGRL